MERNRRSNPTLPPDNATALRRRRPRDGGPTTGKDDALAGELLLARNELLRMPEFQERITAVAKARQWLSDTYAVGLGDPHEALSYWVRLGGFERDLDGIFTESHLDAQAREWRGVKARIDAGWVPGTVSLMAGRQGRGRAMDADAIRLAVRSIALRPKARAELNRERARELRGPTPIKPQVGHEHGQTLHARGASRADELTAAEVNERNGWTGKPHAITAKTIEKYRERLRERVRNLRDS
jgi:hypothetical protein